MSAARKDGDHEARLRFLATDTPLPPGTTGIVVTYGLLRWAWTEIERLRKLTIVDQWTCEAVEGLSWESLDALMDEAPDGEAGRSIVTGWARVADGTAEVVRDATGARGVKFTPEI